LIARVVWAACIAFTGRLSHRRTAVLLRGQLTVAAGATSA
jgi:hypothetical protein